MDSVVGRGNNNDKSREGKGGLQWKKKSKGRWIGRSKDMQKRKTQRIIIRKEEEKGQKERQGHPRGNRERRRREKEKGRY